MERRGCRAPCCKEMAKCQEAYPAAPQEEPPGGFAPEADGLGRSRGGLQSSSRSRTTCWPGVSVATSAARWSSTASGPPPDTTCSATGSPSSSLRGLVPLRGRLLPRQSAERGIHTGPSPVDRGRAGSKRHLITDGHGTPLAVLLTGGNRNDVTQLLPLLDAIPPVRGRVGRPRRKRDSLCADRGYDHDIYRDQVRARGIVPVIARGGTLHGTGLGTYRWVVERSLAWLHGFRRLRIRWERRAGIHEAFLKLARCLITYRQLGSLCQPLSGCARWPAEEGFRAAWGASSVSL